MLKTREKPNRIGKLLGGKHLLALLVYLGVTVPVCSDSVAAEPIFSQQATFFVPFSVSHLASDVEVQLYVSGDFGRTWHLYQRQAPSNQRFSFRAGADGEFWFAIRTGPRGAPDQSADLAEAEMKVLVDTRAPELELVGRKTPDGQVGFAWSAEDLHVNPNSLQFESFDEASGAWQPLSVAEHQQQQQGTRIQGTAAIPLVDLQENARIRMRLADRAGNATVIERTIVQDRAAADSGPPTAGFLGPPTVANNSIDSSVGHWPSNASPSPERNDVSDLAPNVAFVPRKSQRPPVVHRDSSGWQSGARVPAASTKQAPRDLFAAPQLPDRVIDDRSISYGQYATPPPPVAGVSPQPRSQPRLPETPASAGSDRRVSRSQRFEIDYDVDIPDVNDVHRVEVWFTSDGGRTWQHHGDDLDKLSPYVARVDADGVFGFRLIVQARAGFAMRPPAPGDPADVWILVDSTLPRARITSAKYGRGNQLGRLHVTWDVRDDNLLERPVTLLFSDQRQGPWRKITDQLPNTGRYDWVVNDLVARNVFLRLEAKDQAGNLGVDSLRDPIRSDGLAPQGHILDVRPAFKNSFGLPQKR